MFLLQYGLNVKIEEKNRLDTSLKVRDYEVHRFVVNKMREGGN